MLESQYRRIELFDNVSEYADLMRGRRNRLMLLLLALLVIVLGIIVAVRFLAPGAIMYAPLMALAAAALLILPVMIWNNPRVGLYVLALSACLFIQAPPQTNRDPFTLVPLFWNISTTADHFAHTKALGFLHINLGEVLILLTGLFFLMRQITMRELRFNKGAFFGWLTLYIVWCGFGFVRGMSRGGDVTIALWEMRAQTYFFLAYLLATNLISDRKHAITLLWVMAFGIGAKSIVGTINFIKNTGVSADEGVLSHEDSLLMNIILFGAMILSIARVEPKLKWGFMLFVPTAIITSLANGRRAGIAAFLVAFPIVIAMSAVLLRERRAALIKFMVGFVVLGAIYLPLAWNGQGVWALPARAIRSQSSPDMRDLGSDYYRLAENNNLKLTRDTAPWLGIGYGLPYIVAFTQFGRFDPFMNILPHNGILWIWMRLGHVGFVLFWMFVATVLVRGPNMLKAIRDPRLQVLGILAIAVFLMNIIYGQYDLTFANYRTSWLTGTLLGVLAVLPRLVEMKQEERDAQGLSHSGQDESDADDLDVRDMDAKDEEEEPTEDWQRTLKRLPGWTRGADW